MSPFRLDRDRRSNTVWLIIFSDMSTNLMLFFLMMFAMSRMGAEDKSRLMQGMENALRDTKALERRQSIRHAELDAIRMLSDTVAFGSIREYAKIDVRADEVKITLAIPSFYAPGRAELKPEAEAALASLVPAISRFPGQILIEGHTDTTPLTGGRYASNWELSIARAVGVINFFVSKGIPPERFVAGGYGEHHPAYPNDTDEHKALNRRIEVTVLRVSER